MEKLGNFLVFIQKKILLEKNIKILLVHGFGASKNHWRHNQDFLGKFSNCYAIDLLGFGKSSQPSALLNYEPEKETQLNIHLTYGVIKYQHFVQR